MNSRDLKPSAPSRAAAAMRAMSGGEIVDIGIDAYVYGYPLVMMDVTRQVMTAVREPQGSKAPLNQLCDLREFPAPAFTDVVSPNADTLYTLAWLDLKNEPQILSVPDVGKRYYLVQFLDAWTNVFASAGSRTTGNARADFVIIGPYWQGALPVGVPTIRSPTNLVWMIGRTQTNGVDDYGAVHAIQDQYRLTPLSAWGKARARLAAVPVRSDIDTNTAPAKQIAAMNAKAFFGRLNTLMMDNPPAPADAPSLARFAKIGVAPGKAFDLRSVPSALAEGIEQSVRSGQLEIVGESKKSHGRSVNGWEISPAHIANFGTDYSLRAVVALVGLGANLPADAIYPHATVDGSGEPLTGAHRYRIRFPKGQLPPVNAFWSLTLYNDRQAFVDNPIDRYAIGDRDALVADPDGAITIDIQADSPGKERESNWLPAPRGSFNIVMRLYWPQPEIIDGTWKMPPIQRVE